MRKHLYQPQGSQYIVVNTTELIVQCSSLAGRAPDMET